MTKRLLSILLLSFAAFVVSLMVAQDTHSIARPKTVTISNTEYDAKGALSATRVIRQTWRTNGSTALETVSTVAPAGRVIRTRKIQDLSTRRETSMFYDLGLQMIGELPQEAVHARHVRSADCVEFASQVGEAVDGDPFRRRRIMPDGELIQRFDPEVGCEPIEFARVAADGRIYSKAEIVSASIGTDESLFEPDDSLEAVSRVGFLAAYEARYGRPFIKDPAAVARQQVADAVAPLITSQ